MASFVMSIIYKHIGDHDFKQGLQVLLTINSSR
jgi:hypothetical protein